MTAAEYKKFKGLTKESLRDNMSDIEVVLSDLGEITTRDITMKERPQGLEKNMRVAKRGGSVAKLAKEHYEKETGYKAVSNKRSSSSKYTKIKKS